MNVKEFKELIKNLPDDAEIEINTIFENEEWRTSPVCEVHYDKKRNAVYITPEIISIP